MDMAGSGAEQYTQAGRRIAVDTILGTDALLLTEIDGEEGLSSLFRFRLTMISRDPAIAPERLIGSKATVWIVGDDGERSPFCGLISQFRVGPLQRRGFREYRADIVPWLWFLTLTTDCRIFQDMAIPAVIETVFNDLGFTDYTMRGLGGSYPPVDYVVQYRETAFAFVSRLMEEVGIFYFFEHDGTRHLLVLGDSNAALKPAPELHVEYDTSGHGQIRSWQHNYLCRSGAWTQQDFNFESPGASLLTTERSLLKLPGTGALERYDYPGRYAANAHGKMLTRIRIEEDEAAYHKVEATSICASFRSGMKFTLQRHDIEAEQGGTYVIEHLAHRARETSYFSDDGQSEAYDNAIVAFPVATQFRPPRSTEVPVVAGPQTATVVGPPGETIYPDSFGRVKIHFHWDRRGKRDENSSCWVRVSQPWGGGGWGGMFIPHVGHEVVVSFLEGDPDRPIITGRVYNAQSMQAVNLPADKTHSAWRDSAGNEILMEGKAGVQDVRVTAVKDMHVTVTRDLTNVIGRDEATTIGRNRSETVGLNESVAVAVARSHVIGAVDSLSVGAARSVSVGANQAVTIGANSSLTVASGRSVSVGANQAVSIGGSSSLSVGGSLEIEAGEQIIIKTGAASIKMSKDGTIVIQGKDITVKGSGDIVMKASKIAQN